MMNNIKQELINILKAENLIKWFPVRGSKDVVHAVNGVSFCIPLGKTLGLVGESGSGKTTVGRCILKLIDLDRGHIIFDDRDISEFNQTDFRKLRPRIQMVFQEPYGSLDPRMTVQQIIEENIKLEGKSDHALAKSRVYELLEKTLLPRTIVDKFPYELTGSEQQRVAIARAISTNPNLLVLDEPTSDLDIAVRSGIIKLLKNLQQEMNMSYLFISHDLTAVKEISHQVAIMYLGEIIEIGPNPDIFSKQTHPYSQALLASVLFPDPDLKYVNISLKGEIPSPINLPNGCYLHPRCQYAVESCSNHHPELRNISDNRFSACQFSEKFMTNND